MFFIAPMLSLGLIAIESSRVLGYILFAGVFTFHAFLGENYRGEKRIMGLSPKWFGKSRSANDES